MTQIAGGSAPDVIGTGDVQLPTLVNRNFTLDLRPYMDADPAFDSSDWYPEILEGLTYDGKVVGLSDNWDTQALYYNRKLFREAGVAEPTADWTWDDYRAAAEKLTRGEGADKVWGSFWQKWFVPVADAVAAAGGSVYDEAGRRCTLTSPEGIEALTFLDDLRRAGVDPGATEDRVLGREPDEIFAAGNAAMLVGDGRWGAYAFNEAEDLDWAVAELPRGPKGRSNFFHLAAYSIPSNSKNPDLAWAFLRFMTSREGVDMGIAESQGVPAIRSVATSALVADQPIVREHNALQPFLDELPTARRAPQLTDFNRFQDKSRRGAAAAVAWQNDAAGGRREGLQGRRRRVFAARADPSHERLDPQPVPHRASPGGRGRGRGLAAGARDARRLAVPRALSTLHFVIFTVGALVASLVISTWQWDLVTDHRFIGADNYTALFQRLAVLHLAGRHRGSTA